MVELNDDRIKMSGRIKRQFSKVGGSVPEGGGATSTGVVARKKRRTDNNSSDDDERSVWTPKHLGDLRAYNRSASEAPAEVSWILMNKYFIQTNLLFYRFNRV